MIEAVEYVLDFAPDDWPPGTRLVAVAMADRVNRVTLRCWPSIADLAKRTGLSERQVQRCIKVIEDAGWITRHPARVGVCNMWTWCGRPRWGVTPMSPGGVTPMSPHPLTRGVTPMSPKPLYLTGTSEPGAAAL